jgi:hypothetical protein
MFKKAYVKGHKEPLNLWIEEGYAIPVADRALGIEPKLVRPRNPQMWPRIGVFQVFYSDPDLDMEIKSYAPGDWTEDRRLALLWVVEVLDDKLSHAQREIISLEDEISETRVWISELEEERQKIVRELG